MTLLHDLGSGVRPYSDSPPVGISAAPDPIPWAHLRTAVNLHMAAMKQRIAFEDRLRKFGLEEQFAQNAGLLREHERALLLNVRRVYRTNVPAPIRDWQRSTVGIGVDGLARLLGHLGPPNWKWTHEWQGEPGSMRLALVDSSPRSFGQLVAYSALVPGRRRSKGAGREANAACGNPTVATLLHVVADYARIHEGVLRDIYDSAKASYVVRDEWTRAHQHNAALRIVKREILRALWTVAQ